MSDANLMGDKAPETRFVQEFDRKVGLMKNGSNDAWLQDRRRAIRLFAEAGFPTKKTEAYKYTPVTKWIADDPIAPAAKPITTDAPAFDDLPGIHLRTLDGRPSGSVPESLPDGVSVMGLREAYDLNVSFVTGYLSRAAVLERDAFTALAAAFADDGLVVHVAGNAQVEIPIYIHHDSVSPGGFVQPRLLVVVEEGAQARIVEHFPNLELGQSFENRIAEVFLGSRARLDHVLVYERPSSASFINGLYVHQEESSFYRINDLTLGGGLVRNNLNFLPDAEHCETHLFGLYIARGKVHIDNHTMVDHAKPNCFSNELFKGIVADGGTGVFNGKVLVRQDAQKTNAYQSSKSILLDRTARTFGKPELEIYADDVKCSHGATTGELDDEAMFYLRSRGIRPERARMLLLEAFARDVVDLIELEPIREYLYHQLHESLSRTH